MKIPKTPLTFCVVLAASLACAERVTSPASTAGDAGVLASTTGATHESGYGLLTGDDTRYVDCIDDVLHFHAEFPYQWTRTATPSGTVVFKDPFIAGGWGRAESLTNGNVWTIDRYLSPEVIIANAGQESFFVSIVHWVSPTGHDFTIHNTSHFVQNANGDIKVSSFESKCVSTNR